MRKKVSFALYVGASLATLPVVILSMSLAMALFKEPIHVLMITVAVTYLMGWLLLCHFDKEENRQ